MLKRDLSDLKLDRILHIRHKLANHHPAFTVAIDFGSESLERDLTGFLIPNPRFYDDRITAPFVKVKVQDSRIIRNFGRLFLSGFVRVSQHGGCWNCSND